MPLCHPKVSQALLAAGADATWSSDKLSVLHAAAQGGLCDVMGGNDHEPAMLDFPLK